jgi:hypothetical protein
MRVKPFGLLSSMGTICLLPYLIPGTLDQLQRSETASKAPFAGMDKRDFGATYGTTNGPAQAFRPYHGIYA